MSETCRTVKVVSDHPDHDGFVVINEADFDAEVHTKFVGEDDGAEREALVAEIVALGGEKPHHKTGVPKLQEMLAALKPAE